MTQHEMENYRICWLSEQIPASDMIELMKENPDLKEYMECHIVKP